MYYIGFDPGVHGTYFVVLSDTQPMEQIIIPVPTLKLQGYKNQTVIDILGAIASITSYLSDTQFFTEQILPFNQGSKGSFTFGSAIALIGAVQSTGITMNVLTPQSWKKVYALDSDKSKSVNLALKLGLNPHPIMGKKRNIPHNLCESFLLAYLPIFLKSANE